MSELLPLDYQDYLVFAGAYSDGLIVQQLVGQIQDRKKPKCFTLAPPAPQFWGEKSENLGHLRPQLGGQGGKYRVEGLKG